MVSRKVLAAVFCVAMAGALPAFAQQGGGGGGGGGQRFDPAQMRERMNQRTKETMGATDDEWKVLQPKIEKVQTLQMAQRGGFGGGGRRGGPGGGGPGGADQAPTTPVGVASADLRTALENKDASPDVLKQKLQALRDAREKAKQELVAAQAELKELLTVRQEAALVSMGTLD